MTARRWLAVALLALAALFAAWFAREDGATVAVFVLPPLVLAMGLPFRPRHAAFWAGVLALLWFSHGVMVAWSREGERVFALAEVALALAIVFTANHAALKARFGGRRRAA